MKENEREHDSLTENSVNANIKKFHVAFEFENQKKDLIIELSFDEKNKKILPDNKYFDKMYDNLKSKCECDIKQVALEQWNKYLDDKINGYHAQISEDPANNYGDYLILVLFLEMIQYHWSANEVSEQNIWYNVESIQELNNSFLGTTFNERIDYLKSNLMRIVFIDDFPMEVVPQLFKLQNFCTKPLEVDVTSFNFGEKIRYDKDDNKDRTEKVVKEVRRILGIKDDVTDPENSVESNLPKKKAVSKLKFVGQAGLSLHGTVAADWFRHNLCGFTTDEEGYMGVKRIAYAESGMNEKFQFDPYINITKYAPFLDTQTVPDSVETVESSNNLNEVNKPESDTVETMHDPHTGEPMSFQSFASSYLGSDDPKYQKEQKNESSNKMDEKSEDFDPDINREKLDTQTVPNSIETAQYTAESSRNLRQNTETKRGDGEYENFESFKNSRLGYFTPEECEKLGIKCFGRINESVDNSTEDENKTKTQKSKGQLILTWILLILCGIIFVGTPLNAYLSGISFALEIWISVVGIMIFSGLGFGLLLDELKQQNSDISLSSGTESTDYPKTFADYNHQKTKSPLLEDRTKNKDVSNELNDKSN